MNLELQLVKTVPQKINFLPSQFMYSGIKHHRFTLHDRLRRYRTLRVLELLFARTLEWFCYLDKATR